MPVGRGGLTLRPFGEIHIARQVGPPLLPRLNGVEAVSSYPCGQEENLETRSFKDVGFQKCPWKFLFVSDINMIAGMPVIRNRIDAFIRDTSTELTRPFDDEKVESIVGPDFHFKGLVILQPNQHVA